LTVDQFGITELYPTAGGGRTWFSNWQQGLGGLRYITSDSYDVYDSNFGMRIGGSHSGKLGIRCGQCNIKDSAEYRIYVKGPWTNTELTVFAKIKDTTTSSIQLRSRSNHFALGLEPYADSTSYVNPNPQGVPDYISCGFGNYFVRWGQNVNPLGFVDVGIEIIHELYGLGYARVDPYVIPNDEWIGYKTTTRTLENGHVKVEGYNNMNADKTTWDLATEYEFDGSNATLPPETLAYWDSFLTYCADKGDNLSGDINAHQIFTGSGLWNWIRINTATKIDLKYFSVREIQPF